MAVVTGRSGTDADVAVIGAGLTGAAAAWALSRAQQSVVLFEARAFGHTEGSSHGTSRIFRRVYPDPLYVSLTGRAREGWREIEADSGVPLLRETGGLDHGSRRDPRALASVLSRQRVGHRLLSAAEAAERWPGMVFRGPVLHQPDAGVVDADAAVAAFLAVARRHGARTLAHAPVQAIDVQDGHAVVRATESVRARRVVLAAGAWLPELAAGLRTALPLPPLRVTQQQVFHFPQRAPDVRWPVLVHDEQLPVYGLASGADGGPRAAVKVARHDGGIPTTARTRDGVVDPAGRRRIVEYVREWLPGLLPEPVAEATCLYTSTPDEDFVLDRRGPLVVASPCSGHGAKFAPLLGELITDLVLGRDAVHSRFRLDRHAA